MPCGQGIALRADAFPLAVRAGVALRAVALQLAVGARVAVRAVALQLAVGTGVALCAVVFLPPVRASFSSHGSRTTMRRALCGEEAGRFAFAEKVVALRKRKVFIMPTELLVTKSSK